MPQSVARCPVCGDAPGISADAFLAELDPNEQTADNAPNADFPQNPASDGHTAPNGRVFTPPPLLDEDVLPRPHPTRRGHASGSAAPHTTAKPARSRTRTEDHSPGAADSFEDLDDEQPDPIVRTVRAISNRLDAEIRIGRTRGHPLLVAVAPLAAVAVVIFGTYSAYNYADLDQPVFIESEEGAAPGTLAFGAEQAAAAQLRADEVAGQINEVTALNCGVTTTANVIALSPTRYVTNASTVANDNAPVLRLSDGTSHVGTVIGRDRATSIAVIEMAEYDSVDALEWGVTDRVLSDPSLIIVEQFGAAIKGTPATADEIDGVVGLVTSFSFSGSTFRPGSAVLNSDGFIIGMVDDTGRSAISGSELSSAFGRVLARPSSEATPCAVAEEPALDESGSESEADADAEESGTDD